MHQGAWWEKETWTMDRNKDGLATREPGEKNNKESGASDLRETLGKVDRTLEAFYQIHGPVIKDQGRNA
jgi:hypothetical protein